MTEEAVKVPDALIETYVIANTPGHLVRAFRTESFVLNLVPRGQEALLQEAHLLGTKAERSFAETVRAYAFLVALGLTFVTQQPRPEVRGTDFGTLRWARPILEMMAGARIPLVITNLTCTPPVRQPEESLRSPVPCTNRRIVLTGGES